MPIPSPSSSQTYHSIRHLHGLFYGAERSATASRLHKTARFRHNSSMSIASILGPKGSIARRLSNYESRPQQLDMADAVARAIADRRHLMVEAGTGVGKSFAYLVPAIQAAPATKDFRILSSPHT